MSDIDKRTPRVFEKNGSGLQLELRRASGRARQIGMRFEVVVRRDEDDQQIIYVSEGARAAKEAKATVDLFVARVVSAGYSELPEISPVESPRRFGSR